MYVCMYVCGIVVVVVVVVVVHPEKNFVRKRLKINAFRISAKNFSKKIRKMFGCVQNSLYLCKRKREINSVGHLCSKRL